MADRKGAFRGGQGQGGGFDRRNQHDDARAQQPGNTPARPSGPTPTPLNPAFNPSAGAFQPGPQKSSNRQTTTYANTQSQPVAHSAGGRSSFVSNQARQHSQYAVADNHDQPSASAQAPRGPGQLNRTPLRAGNDRPEPQMQRYNPRNHTGQDNPQIRGRRQEVAQQPREGDNYDYADKLETASTDLEGATRRVKEHAKELVRNPPRPKPTKQATTHDGKTAQAAQNSAEATAAATKPPTDNIAGSEALPLTEEAMSNRSDLTIRQVVKDAETAKFHYGLRASFGHEGQDAEIATNYLTVKTPNYIHVYHVDMTRAHDKDRKPIVVRKKADRMLVMEKLHVDVRELQDRPRFWVYDAHTIWSTKKVFPQGVLGTAVYTTPALGMYYDSEMGTRLHLEQVDIRYTHQIDLSQPVARLMYDASDIPLDESLPSVLIRGLNAFFANHVNGHRNGIVSIGGNRSFAQVPGSSLGKEKVSHIRALTGFSLSTRPGNSAFLLNISTAASPFFRKMTVRDFMDRAWDSGKDEREINAMLRGVKAEISHDTHGGSQPPRPIKTRFITEVICTGYEPCPLGPAPYPNTTLESFYDGMQWRTHAEFPTTPFAVVRSDWPVNVGKAVTYNNDMRNAEGSEWFPASQLQIVEWQAVRGILTSDETSGMIKVALRTPQMNANMLLGTQNLQQGLSHFGFAGASDGNNQAGLAAFGMEAGRQLLKIKGRWLGAPVVSYGEQPARDEGDQGSAAGRGGRGGSGRGDYGGRASRGGRGGIGGRGDSGATTEPSVSQQGVARVEHASWNLDQIQFCQPSTVTDLPITNFSEANDAAVKDVKKIMVKALVHAGLVPKNPRIPENITCPPNRKYEHTAKFEDVIQKDFPRISSGTTTLVLLQQKSFDRYATIKRIGDLKLGVNTICLNSSETVWRKQKWAFNQPVAANLALKYNLKGAGYNHVLEDGAFKPLDRTRLFLEQMRLILAPTPHLAAHPLHVWSEVSTNASCCSLAR